METLQSLSKTLTSLKYPGGNFEDKFAQLAATWKAREIEYSELEEQIEPALNIQNDYYEGLESLVEWLDTMEDLLESLKKSDNYDLFKEALDCFEVCKLCLFNDYYEGLESLVEWLDAMEDLLESLKKSDNYDLFKEALDCFEVCKLCLFNDL